MEVVTKLKDLSASGTKLASSGANLAVGAMGYATMGLFIFEEAVQCSMFGIYIALSVRDYAHAKVSIELTRDILSKATIYMKTLGLLSAFNIVPFKAFFVASDATLDVYEAKIDLMKLQDERKLRKITSKNKDKIKAKPPEKTTIKEHNRTLKAKIDQIIGNNPDMIIDKVQYIGFVIADTTKEAMRAAREVYGDFEWYVVQKMKKPKTEGEYSPYASELSPEIEQKLDVTGLDKYNVFKIIVNQLPGFPEFQEEQEQKLITEGELLRDTTKIEQMKKDKLEEISKSWPLFKDKPYSLEEFWQDMNNQYIEDTIMPIQTEIEKAPAGETSEEEIKQESTAILPLQRANIDFAPATLSADRKTITVNFAILGDTGAKIAGIKPVLYAMGAEGYERLYDTWPITYFNKWNSITAAEGPEKTGYMNFIATVPEGWGEITKLKMFTWMHFEEPGFGSIPKEYHTTININDIFPEGEGEDWTVNITAIDKGTLNQGDQETVNYKIQKLNPEAPNKILVKMTIQNYDKSYTTEVFADVYGEFQNGNFTEPVNTNTFYRYIDTAKLAGYCSILIELFELDGTKIMERRFLNKFMVQLETPATWLEME